MQNIHQNDICLGQWIGNIYTTFRPGVLYYHRMSSVVSSSTLHISKTLHKPLSTTIVRKLLANSRGTGGR